MEPAFSTKQKKIIARIDAFMRSNGKDPGTMQYLDIAKSLIEMGNFGLAMETLNRAAGRRTSEDTWADVRNKVEIYDLAARAGLASDRIDAKCGAVDALHNATRWEQMLKEGNETTKHERMRDLVANKLIEELRAMRK